MDCKYQKQYESIAWNKQNKKNTKYKKQKFSMECKKQNDFDGIGSNKQIKVQYNAIKLWDTHVPNKLL